MVIFNKPLKFIMAALVACLPFNNFANPTQDSIHAHAEAHADIDTSKVESVSVHVDEHGAGLDVKTKNKQHILHHVQDSHDFTFFSPMFGIAISSRI